MGKHFYPERVKDGYPNALGRIPEFPVDRLPSECEDVWVRLWSQGSKVLMASSEDAIVGYCRTLYLADKAWNNLQSEDMVDIGSQDQSVVSAFFRVWEKLQLLLAKQQHSLGLTPKAAAELGLTSLQIESAIEDKFTSWVGDANDIG